MEYEDFIIEIGLGEGREYPVAIVRSPAGEAHATMLLPFDEPALQNELARVQNALLRNKDNHRNLRPVEDLLPTPNSAHLNPVMHFGAELFKALFNGDIRSGYDVSKREAQHSGKGLRLVLRVEPPHLAALPWEFLYDVRSDSFLALEARTPIVRYPELFRVIEPIRVEPPLRILGMVTNPDHVQMLDTNHEKHRLEKALAKLQQTGMVELHWLEGQTWRDLQRAMREEAWHIFHFIGHGGFDSDTNEGVVVFADEQNRPHLLPATQLATMLVGYRPPRLVLLNACKGAYTGQKDLFSSTASILVRRGIPAVVAMQFEITDRAAIEFSRAFYEAIAGNLPVEAAISESRNAIQITGSNTSEWGIPVLYTHASDGVLFKVPNSAMKPKTNAQESDSNPQSSQSSNLPSRVDTGGGAYIGGSVHIEGGSFSGRDQFNLTGEPGITVKEFVGLIDQLRSALSRVELADDEKEAVQQDLAGIDAQLAKPQPKLSLIKRALNNVKEIVEATAGVGTAALGLAAVAQRAIDMAQQLFK